eukprot:scaffold170157_cov41-Prasinocladus_malaysianus.AAC.1
MTLSGGGCQPASSLASSSSGFNTCSLSSCPSVARGVEGWTGAAGAGKGGMDSGCAPVPSPTAAVLGDGSMAGLPSMLQSCSMRRQPRMFTLVLNQLAL